MTGVLPLSSDELLTTTRSVRKRLDLTRPVPLDVIRECLEIARQAPTGGNRQDWHWLVVTDRGHRTRIGELYAESFGRYRRASTYGATRGGTPATQSRVKDSAEYLAEVMGRVPVLVIGALDVGGDGELPPGNQAGLWGSLLPAAWSFQLAARARGLGSAWTTLHLRHERAISELLGVPPSVRQGVLLPVAYYTGETFRPAPRGPLDDVLHVDGW
ncbi:MAG: nitroreductase family protein [Pseudonocardia sp.]